jgi:serine/threonine-protein kinase
MTSDRLTSQMTPADRHDDDSEERLFEVLTEYLQAVEAGTALGRDAFLENHPELALRLAAFLDEEERLHELVEPIRRVAADRVMSDSHQADGCSGSRDPLPVMDGPRDFGEYELVEVIGAGGMGVVFRARQKRLDRWVALKMIKGGDLASADERRRFRLEAGAIAQLDHPHIVPIYEVGEFEGHCYYAMKLIEGGSLDRRLSEFVADPPAAARLVATIARAVHHAHERGVLHRDLKPSNILIDHQGQGHVADFGLAKRLGPWSDATGTGIIMGTPSYMAPEQASGKKDAVTTATDVYGLGALLYSLLAGRPPFRGDSILETIDLVRQKEPEPPTRVSGRLDRDLQTICLTCLRKEPERRYGSAAALADDLDRWSAGEPIAARPISVVERAWRWARREPLSAGLALAVVVLFVAGAVGLIISNIAIARERDLAQAQRRIALDQSRHAEVERQRALEHARQARKAVDEMYTSVAEKWLYEQPKLSQIQRDFLEKALAFYQKFAREDGAGPDVELEQAKALSRLAWLQLRLGRPSEAESSLYEPVQTLQNLVDRYPDRAIYLQELGRALSTLGSYLSEQKRWQEANGVRERALSAQRDLVKRFPAVPDYRIALATNQVQLALQYQFTGRPALAQKLAVDSLASLDGMKRDFPGRTDPHDLSTRMRVLEDVGCVRAENRRLVEAEAALRESLAIAEHLPEHVIAAPDLSHRVGHISIYLGYTLGRLGQWRQARVRYGRALQIFERLAGDFPDHPLYQVDVIDAELGLVDDLAATQSTASAADHARRQVERSAHLASAHPDMVNCRRTLLAALMRLGKLDADVAPGGAALAAYRRAIAVALGLVAAEPAGVYPRHHLGMAQRALGEQLCSSGREQEGEAMVVLSVDTLESLVHDSPAVSEFQQALGEARMSLGELRWDAGRRDEAENAFGRALELLRGVDPHADADPDLTARCVRGLISCPDARFRDPSRALALAQRAAERFPKNAVVAGALGLARYHSGDWKGTIAALTTASTLEGHGDRGAGLILALAYDHAGDPAQARSAFDHARATLPPGLLRDRFRRRLYEEAEKRLDAR